MKRREFITLLGGAAAAWPLAARAQQAGKVQRIGFLWDSPAVWPHALAGFRTGLRDLGWIDGQTAALQYRWAESRGERFAEFAIEFVRLGVDIIVASSTAAALACKEATGVIPIVLPLTGDPGGTGLVASLARPGGNLTALTNQASDLAG